MSFHRARLFHIALIVFLGLTVYSNTFDVPFQFDDRTYIEENPVIMDFHYLLYPSEGDALMMDNNVRDTLRTRQVGYASLFLNYRAHGLEPAGYHAVNIAVHLANALLVYLLVLLTFKAPALEGSALGGRSAALLSALLFVSHPVQTQAVTYISQRFASLAAMFCLLCVVFYALSRLSENRARRYALYGLSLISAALAMKTKENSFTLPLAVAFYEFMFFGGAVRKRLLRLTPLLLTMLIIPLSVMDFERPLGEALAGAINSQMVELSGYDYLATQFRVLVTYLRLLALPVNQNVDYDYPMYGSFLDAGVLLSLVLLAGVVLLGVYLYRLREPSGRLVAFGVFWFFIMLSVESSIIPLEDVMFEHRLYLPSAGIIVATASGMAVFIGKLSGRRLLAAVTTIAIVLSILAGAAYKRNTIWESKAGLWADAVAKSPQKARPYHNLGDAYQSEGLFDSAVDNYETAIRLYPGFVEAHNNLGSTLGSLGQIDKAIKHLERATELKPDFAMAYYNLGIAYSKTGQNEKAIEHFRRTVELDPYYAEAHHNLGIAYTAMGQSDKAKEHFRKAEELARRK